VGSTYFSPLAQPICYMPKSKGGVPCYNNPIGEVGVSLDDGINWTTGGGFSNVQPRPGYQKRFVENYLTNHADLLPPDSAFNRTGRAYPDVATVGHNLMVAFQGQFIGVGTSDYHIWKCKETFANLRSDGTSASAPIFGGIVSLLNDVRARNGKPSKSCNICRFNPRY
jgi:tripeptidyl-peptidase-1